MDARTTRRGFLRLAAVAGVAAALRRPLLAEARRPSLRFAITADCHLLGRTTPSREAFLRGYVKEMTAWKPDFVVDLGDFACQAGQGTTSRALHDAQLEGLVHNWAALAKVPCPVRIAMGNHDVGWIKGGDEKIQPEDLIGRSHAGEDITKGEFLAVTGMPHRYYSFDVKGYHLIVLDANNVPPANTPKEVLGHDGIPGAYFIDDAQRTWLAKDLAASGEKTKIVFCHQELHHTPAQGSPEGGDVPFRPVGKPGSFVGNGWQLREMFRSDGRVLACFFGHRHQSRWTVHGGVNYFTMAAAHAGGSYARVTVADELHIEGHANQRSYRIPLAEHSLGQSA